MHFVVMDKTATHAGEYIAEDGRNVNLLENAEIFATHEGATARATERDPSGNWAVVAETE